jgi:hypothetical protein
VTIVGMQVAKHCQAPLTGTFFDNRSQGGGSTIPLGFDLDGSVEDAQNVQDYSSFSGNYFQEHVVTLKPREPQTFKIWVHAERYYCTFTINMSVSAEKFGIVSEPISDKGKPFELTGGFTLPRSAFQVVYVGGIGSGVPGGGWAPERPKPH